MKPLPMLLALVFCALTAATAAPLPRLKIQDNYRFLVTADAKPFFYLGDTRWQSFHRLNREEAVRLFDNRAARKFNVLRSVAIAELEDPTDPNHYGHLRFENLDVMKPAVKNGPRDGYWDHVDFIVREANTRGFSPPDPGERIDWVLALDDAAKKYRAPGTR